MSPSTIKSSRAEIRLRVGKGARIPLVNDGSACAIVSMHIATSGQSGQPLFFCPSGQHGISPDMADISVISATEIRFAAAGVTSGAATSPAITSIASKRPMSRRAFMA